VAWVAERKDVLSTLFWLATTALYVRYAGRPSPGRLTAVVLAFALGLLAKPMLVTLPCVLLLLDYWPLRRLRIGLTQAPVAEGEGDRFSPAGFPALLKEKLPLFALAGLSCWLTVAAQTWGGAVQPLHHLPFPARVANALVAYVAYLGKTFWPTDLAVYYPLDTVPPGQAAGAALLLAVLTLLALREARRRPYLLVGWLWFLGALVPVIGLVQVGDQARADRYTYVPHLGLFVALVWGAADLLAALRVPVAAQALLASIVLAGCAALTWAQVGHWKDTLTLWEHSLRVTGPNYRGEAGLGYTLYERGRLEEAIPHLSAAL
jgi:hypothetical protein